MGNADTESFRWAGRLKENYENVMLLRVGGEVVPDNPEKALEKVMELGKTATPILNASGLRDAAITILGEERYFNDFYRDWNQCKAGGVVKGLKLVWGEGMKELGNGWERLYKGEVEPDEGLVFALGNDRSGKS
jgi:hypothetical protein